MVSNEGSTIGKDQASETLNVQFVLECLEKGEYGDGELFAKLFRDRVIYDTKEEEWYIWVNHHWELDTRKQIRHLVSGKLASVYIRAGAVLNVQASEEESRAETIESDTEKS